MKILKITLLFSFIIVRSTLAQEIVIEPDSVIKKRIIKVDFFSPLTGNLTLGYEQYLKDFTSIEIKLGIIGIGDQQYYSASGAFIKIGPKFKLKPSYATKGTFGTHLLRGSYIRPEIVLSAFNWKIDYHYYYNNNDNGEEKNIRAFAFLINYGMQFIIGKNMSLDFYAGLGYNFSNEDPDSYYHGYLSGESSLIAFNTGLTIGLLMK